MIDIKFNVPPYVDKAADYIQECVKNQKICGDGEYTKKCNAWIEERTGTGKCLLTTSCTHATELAALLCDIRPGDEVIMPSYTFVSTADAFVLRGAIPVFVDIRPDTMNIDETLIEDAITEKTRAIVPVHYAGVACEMDTIMDIARRHNLKVVEDAAQGIMATYKGKALGTIGDFGAYSFHETKNYSMGEGGALLIRDQKDVEEAEIIREKGTNGEREMAYSLYLAGFDVKDVTMTDLISGRETLEDVNMIVYCGGFSNSDVLGSAKGWAGAFLFNPKAKEALDKYYAREDTLSLGVCNGCQLMMELNLINPEHKKNGKMLHNDSHKFESRFLGVTVPTNRSVMLGSLSGSKLGIWVAHGEGKFSLPYDEDKYNVVLKYSYDEYPSNPNGSDYSIAGLASADGRHLAMMPHLERAIFPWQNGCYPADRVNSDQITPWVEAFVNARKWVEANKK